MTFKELEIYLGYLTPMFQGIRENPMNMTFTLIFTRGYWSGCCSVSTDRLGLPDEYVMNLMKNIVTNIKTNQIASQSKLILKQIELRQWAEQNCSYPFYEVRIDDLETETSPLLRFSHEDDRILFKLKFA